MFLEFLRADSDRSAAATMIRRLADRLVSVDLLDQAAELLQYQIDKRLEGRPARPGRARLAWCI